MTQRGVIHPRNVTAAVITHKCARTYFVDGHAINLTHFIELVNAHNPPIA